MECNLLTTQLPTRDLKKNIVAFCFLYSYSYMYIFTFNEYFAIFSYKYFFSKSFVIHCALETDRAEIYMTQF